MGLSSVSFRPLNSEITRFKMNTRTLNIPPEVKREIEEFASEVERLHRGEVGEEDFKRFRLQQGIYGQRQADEQMVRFDRPR